MSVVAAAVVGGAVVSAYATNKASSKASKASEAGADAAAQAQIRTTEMQIAEMSRQFDYQMEVLQPQLQQQFNAQRAYSDMLGIGGPEMTPQQARGVASPETGYVSTARPRALQDQRRQQEIAQYQGFVDRGDITQAVADREIAAIRARPYDQEQLDQYQADRGAAGLPSTTPRAQMPGPGQGRRPGARGDFFRDPNLDPTRMSDASLYSDQVRDTLLAGETAEGDPYREYIEGTSLAADDLGSDMIRQDIEGRQLAEGAAGTDIYGDVFTESPGYAFQREEMERQLERVGSAGGPNIGGRAIMESQRRAQGLAAGDYYNWAQGRSRDVDRLAGAEAQDASRLDQTAYAFRDQQTREQQRGDVGYQDWMRRREGDVARMDEAARYDDTMLQGDIQRTDQSYYNYMNMVAGQAGFGGGPAAQAVQAAGQQGRGVASAYGQSGDALSRIALNQGNVQAQISANEYAGYNNALQGGVQNWMTYQNMQPPTPTNPTHTGPPPGGWTPATTGPR